MPSEVFTKEQLVEALGLITMQGLSVIEAAAKLEISKGALFQRLRRVPQYRLYREQQKTKEDEAREKVLAMGRTGYTVSIIARDLGLPLTTTHTWLLRAGIDTSCRGSDDLVCPECSGTMKKQELFFWLCDGCGSEWWPKDAPNNPDDWARPWRIRYKDGGKEMLGIVNRLRNEGYSTKQIRDELNDRGIKTPQGKEWTTININQQFRRRGITSQGGDIAKIEDITRTLVEKGLYGKDIAIRLNSEGLMNSVGTEWNKHSVSRLCQRMGVTIKGRHKKINLKSDCAIHPWKTDENARHAKNNAWRRAHDVPSL